MGIFLKEHRNSHKNKINTLWLIKEEKNIFKFNQKQSARNKIDNNKFT
jgi:hypothetical protein